MSYWDNINRRYMDEEAVDVNIEEGVIFYSKSYEGRRDTLKIDRISGNYIRVDEYFYLGVREQTLMKCRPDSPEKVESKF